MPRKTAAAVVRSIIICAMASPAYAQEGAMTSLGFTGFGLTPSASTIPWGNMQVVYGNRITNGPGTAYSKYGQKGSNIITGFGVLPNLEFSGRIAANSSNANCFIESCGVRDLSFNTKAAFPLDDKGHLKVAVGATDVAGSINYFRTIYGVIGYAPENYDVNLGYGHRTNPTFGDGKPLNGIFGSLALRPSSIYSAHLEYNESKAWAGGKVHVPNGLLPEGWDASVGINIRIAGNDISARTTLTASLSIPLFKPPENARQRRNAVMERYSDDESIVSNVALGESQFSASGLPKSTTALPQPAASLPPKMNAPAPSSNRPTEDQLSTLAEELAKHGFEDIRVGITSNNVVIIKLNNAVYNVNTADAVGAALGIIARQLGAQNHEYILTISQRQVEVVGVSGSTSCLLGWLAGATSQCSAGKILTPGTTGFSAAQKNTDWIIANKAQSWKTVRLIAQPIINTAIATDYGVLDYSAGVLLTVQQPLWAGAYGEISHITPIAKSINFRDGAPFSQDRLMSKNEKALIHQVVRLPIEKLFGQKNLALANSYGASALFAHVAVGSINSNYNGAYGELRWEPAGGRHRFGYEGGDFERASQYDFLLPIKARPSLASYRYSFKPTKTDFEVTGGQFMYGDRGAQILMSQWFDDVAVNFYVRRTRRSYEADARTFAGIELVFPLTPRKDMLPVNNVQITGTSRFAYGVETKIGAGLNALTRGMGTFPGVATLDKTFNADRGGAEYYEENAPRIKTAAQQ